MYIMYGSRAASVNMCRGRYRDEEEARFVFDSRVYSIPTDSRWADRNFRELWMGNLLTGD